MNAEAAWAPAGTINTGRVDGTLTVLQDGRVLAIGGWPTDAPSVVAVDAVDIFEPATGSWTSAASLPDGRAQHGAVLLADGRVLVTGGQTSAEQNWGDTAARIYDPASDSWSTAANMIYPRNRHTSILLPDGRVIVLGGDYAAHLPHAEIYDPVANTWTETATPPSGLFLGTPGTLLPDGRVLVLAREVSPPPPVYGPLRVFLYDPSADSWTPRAIVGGMANRPFLHLSDGRILLIEGIASGTGIDAYDLVSDTWSNVGSLTRPRFGHQVMELANGIVLATGDTGAPAEGATVEIYDPVTETASPMRPMTEGRGFHNAAPAGVCAVLVTGGYTPLSVPSTSEVFDPLAGGAADIDSDCIPDVYEAIHACMTVGVNDAAVDFDGDGLMHFAEYDWDGAPCSDDGDGCHDIEERGSNLALGGQRDPFNPWDFADVPTPALPMAGAARNGAVALTDIGAALTWVGTANDGGLNVNGRDYDNDDNANGVEDGAEYDRTPNGQISGPPNGAVSLSDVGVILAQVGDNCTAAPN